MVQGIKLSEPISNAWVRVRGCDPKSSAVRLSGIVGEGRHLKKVRGSDQTEYNPALLVRMGFE